METFGVRHLHYGTFIIRVMSLEYRETLDSHTVYLIYCDMILTCKTIVPIFTIVSLYI